MNEDNGVHNIDSQPRLDAGSFFSSVLGFGNLNKDKLETFSVGRRRSLISEELYTLYEQNNFIGNVIDAVPDAAGQKWCEYEADSNAEEIQEELDKVKPHINQAWKQARLQGWAAVLLLINDGEQDYRQPVNVRAIRGIRGYNALSGGKSGEITVTEYDDNPFSVTYGEPQLFTITGSNELVHVSRLLLFYGVKNLSKTRGRSHGQLGTSVIDRCYQEFRNFDVGNNAIAATLPDFNLDIFEIPGLAQLLAKQKDFADYISGLAFARSVLKVMMVEAGQSGQNPGGYKIVARQYTGVKDLLEHFKALFAGATDIPHTQLFNESPSGTTSGRYEDKYWSTYIHARQEDSLRPELIKLIGYLHAMRGRVPRKWSLEFPTLFELTEVEEADVELKESQRLALLVDKMIVTPDEAAKSLAEGIDVGQAIDLEQRREEMLSLQAFPEGIAQLPPAREAAEENTSAES